MPLTEEQYRARIAYLRSRTAEILFPQGPFEKIASLIKGMVRYGDEIEVALFQDLEETRVLELDGAVAKAVATENGSRVTLSLLDMFDLERITLLAERDPQAFAGPDGIAQSRSEIQSLANLIESIRMQVFP